MYPSFCTLDSPLGILVIRGDAEGIASIGFGLEKSDPPASVPSLLEEAARQLAAYFASARQSFDLPLHWHGTPFETRVWQYLLTIPFGETRTYGQLAGSLGAPGSARAVGTANSRNPLAIVVPCHRVVGTGGKLTGYAGGLWRKEWLLRHENPPTQIRLFDELEGQERRDFLK